MEKTEVNLRASTDTNDSALAALEFAEKSWKDASQANFLLEKKLSDTEEKYKAQIKRLTTENKQLRRDVQIWRTAYETVINSKTWKMAHKLKGIVGKKD